MTQHSLSNKLPRKGGIVEAKANRISEIQVADYSPEKAGVGGSIPSLATIFPITYELNSNIQLSNYSAQS